MTADKVCDDWDKFSKGHLFIQEPAIDRGVHIQGKQESSISGGGLS
jgi:hypothetical protein